MIDLAIVDSACPGRYLLGIECDGATYHSSRSARDRDRLRETVLEDRGWRMHRVWSTDWFHRPGEQLQKIIMAIAAARRDLELDEEKDAAEDTRPVEGPVTETDVERAPAVDGPNGDAEAAWVSPYLEAAFPVPSATPIHETSPSVLADVVARVVEIEGPIHREEIAKRITTLWGQSRTGGRIAESISRAIESGVRSGVLLADPAFVTHGQQANVAVRSRSNVTSSNLKKPEMIPPAELRQAILCLVAEQVGLRRDEIPLKVARAIGFKTTGAKLKDLIEKALTNLINESLIVVRDQKLFLP